MQNSLEVFPNAVARFLKNKKKNQTTNWVWEIFFIFSSKSVTKEEFQGKEI